MRFESNLLYILIYILVQVDMINALTQEQRGELARKFKYYHASVRPGDKFNLVETINGTFFHLNTEIELLQTRPTYEQLYLEMVMIVHYHDDRLVLRELNDILTVPDEFQPWLPTLEPSPFAPMQKSIHVDPKTGQLTVFFRIQSMISCYTEAWKSPFERFSCNLGFSTEQDERIFIRSNRDLRPDTQIRYVEYTFDEWPYMVFHFDYDTHWHSAVVNSYLPSILIFSVVVFAQWKRRKIQIIVTVAAMVSIVFMQTAQRKYNTITMQDLWMSAILIHLIAILTVDLLLPSRRIVHTTISASRNGYRQSIDESESPRYRHFSQPHESTPLMEAYSSSQLDLPRPATLVAAGSEVRIIRSPSMAGFS
uniref:Transmembrane ion channel n=1 Tax=Acrobeloides nanus TaxID=290746 RepID=A0A914D5C0_9BILA